MATLRNQTRVMQVCNLPHDPYCSDGECRCVEVRQHHVGHDNATGKVAVAEKTPKLAASITFLAGETKAGLPDTILSCPDIKGAIDRRELAEVKE